MSATKSGIKFEHGELTEAQVVFLLRQLAKRVQPGAGKYFNIEIDGRPIEVSLTHARERSNGDGFVPFDR